MAKADNFKGCLRTLTLIPKGRCRSIQVADFFAFYSRRYIRDHDRFGGRLRLPMNTYLDIINKHVPIKQNCATEFSAKPIGHLSKMPAFDNLQAWRRIVDKAKG